MKITPKIAIPLKGMADADWSAPLRIYFTSTYGSPDAYIDDIHSLNKLRVNARGAGTDKGGRAILLDYYKQLELLELRIPVNETSCRINFTWQDSFSKAPTTQHSLAYEKASLLFNIAAINSHIAVDAEDLRIAYKSFQQSAGLYQFIFDKFLHAPSTDLTQETVKALSKLMLAQAQESFVETCINNESSKPAMNAKLAKGASKLYTSATDLLKSISDDKTWGQKAWHQYTSIKSKYYLAVAHNQQSLACEQKGKYGEAIVHLQTALKHLQELTTQPVPSAYTKFSDDISNLTKSVTERLGVLERDNDFIYHDTIPNATTLGDISGLEAAKPTSYADQVKENESQFSEKELFKSVIPLSIHKLTSLYSEEKAKILRAQDENIEIANEELASALEFLSLPKAISTIRNDLDASQGDILSLGDAHVIPSEVNDWAQKISSAASISTCVADLDGLRRPIYENAQQITALLKAEEQEYNDNKSQFKERWSQVSSTQMTSGIWDDVSRVKGDLAKGAGSDDILQRNISNYQRELDILQAGPNNPTLLAEFEQVDKGGNSQASVQNLLDLDTSSDNTVILGYLNDTENILSTLNKLKKERTATFADFKERVHADDISTILVLNQKRPDIEETLFKEELMKFDPYLTRFEQMNYRQKELLKQLTIVWKQVLQDQTVQTKKKSREEGSAKKQALVEKYRKAYIGWKDFQDGFQNGMGYYRNLGKFALSLKSNANDLVGNRREEAAKLRNTMQNNSAQYSQDFLREQLSRLSVSSNSNPIPSNSTPSPRSSYSAGPPPPQTTAGPPSGLYGLQGSMYAAPPRNASVSSTSSSSIPSYSSTPAAAAPPLPPQKPPQQQSWDLSYLDNKPAPAPPLASGYEGSNHSSFSGPSGTPLGSTPMLPPKPAGYSNAPSYSPQQQPQLPPLPPPQQQQQQHQQQYNYQQQSQPQPQQQQQQQQHHGQYGQYQYNQYGQQQPPPQGQYQPPNQYQQQPPHPPPPSQGQYQQPNQYQQPPPPSQGQYRGYY